MCVPIMKNDRFIKREIFDMRPTQSVVNGSGNNLRDCVLSFYAFRINVVRNVLRGLCNVFPEHIGRDLHNVLEHM